MSSVEKFMNYEEKYYYFLYYTVSLKIANPEIYKSYIKGV
jgi:hypothetical protein